MTIENFLEALTNPMVVFIGLMAAGLIATLAVAVGGSASNVHQVSRMDAALRAIASSELQIDTSLIGTGTKRRSWGQYWTDLYTQTGRTPKHPQSAVRLASTVVAVGAVVGFFGFPGGAFGLVAGPVALLGGLRFWLGLERNKRLAAIDKQLPTLLAGLRANLSAQSTPQQALMSVADDMPAPLGDELRALKRDINVNVGLDQALAALAERVTSREMKFLVSSIQIAVRNGADLVPQIAVIQEIVQQRTRIRQKLRAAVSQVKPTQYLALAAVPFMFIVSLQTPSQAEFWFGSGLLWLIVAGGLYAAGAFIIKMMIKSVENT